MTSLAKTAVLAAALMAAAPALGSDAGIPTRIRILKGSRMGPPAVAPGLHDLEHQLSHTAYVHWDEVGASHVAMEFKRPVTLLLPDGEQVVVTLLESRRDTATYEVLVPSSRTHSRLTIPKDKRIVHQVTPERGGEAFFVTIRPWP